MPWEVIPGSEMAGPNGSRVWLEATDELLPGERAIAADDALTGADRDAAVEEIRRRGPPGVWRVVDGQTGAYQEFGSPSKLTGWPERIEAAGGMPARLIRAMFGLLPRRGRPPGPKSLTDKEVKMFTGDGRDDYPAAKQLGLSDATFAQLNGYTPSGFEKLKRRASGQGLPI
jgi:hypothetical protein